MTASTTDRSLAGNGAGLGRDTIARAWTGPVAAGEILYKGCLAGIERAETADNPPLVDFVADGSQWCVGFVKRGLDNSAGSADSNDPVAVLAQAGTLIDVNAGGGDAITNADRWKPIFGVDNQTCSKLPADGDPIGVLVCMDPSSGLPVVLVDPLLAVAMLRGGVEQLTENNGAIGGSNDGNLPSLTATASAVTDNSGGATTDGTIGVITPASTITDNSGGVDPGNNTIAAITNANNAGSADVVPTAAAIAQLVAKMNTTRTALIAVKDAVAELASAINKNTTDEVALRAAVREVAAKVNEIVVG